MPTLCLKYNKLPHPCLKHTGSMAKKPNFAKIVFLKVLSHKNCG
jgi:hypothetical protein